MKAVVFSEYGTSEVLSYDEVIKPEPKENEVLVKIHASSINDWDWGIMRGDWVNRLLFGLTKPKINILGLDVAGVVEQVGKNVDSLKPGDRVFADLSSEGFGGYAEFVCAPASVFGIMPDDMSFEDGAAIPHSGMLAYNTLVDHWELKDGQKILINGAGGGVGPIALAICKQFDIEVTGVDHTDKMTMLKELGFDHVIDYTKENLTKSGKQYDLIFDVKTLQSPKAFNRALKPDGAYLTVGGPISRILAIAIFGLFSKNTFKVVFLEPNKNFPYINRLYEAGKLKLQIDGPHNLKDLSQAMDHYESGNQKGRVVISIP